MFRRDHPVAWSFLQNTKRWTFNVTSSPKEESAPPNFKEYSECPEIDLPSPLELTLSLKEAFEARCSCRSFSSEVIGLTSVATIMDAAYGTHDSLRIGDQEMLERYAPSGGGLYPLELYAMASRVEGLEEGIYHYHPLIHRFQFILEGHVPPSLISNLLLGQPYAASAPLLILLTGVTERCFWKYGDRGLRYMMLEAGHVAQNINLAAAALGLGSLNLGGFFDDEMANLLKLEGDGEYPLYAVAVGSPAARDKGEIRTPADPA